MTRAKFSWYPKNGSDDPKFTLAQWVGFATRLV